MDFPSSLAFKPLPSSSALPFHFSLLPSVSPLQTQVSPKNPLTILCRHALSPTSLPPVWILLPSVLKAALLRSSKLHIAKPSRPCPARYLAFQWNLILSSQPSVLSRSSLGFQDITLSGFLSALELLLGRFLFLYLPLNVGVSQL